MQRKTLRTVLSLLAAILLSYSLVPATADDPGVPQNPLDTIQKYLDSGADFSEEQPENFALLERAALEAGESAVPILKPALENSPDEMQRYGIAYLLTLAGGPRAKNILKAEYDRRPATALKTLLCFSMGSTGTQEDVAFLVETLRGDRSGHNWAPIEAAALTLGVLKPKNAIEPLSSCAQKDPKSRSSDAAREALNWMQNDRLVPQSPTAPTREKIILTLFQSGIPRTGLSREFLEPATSLCWIYSENTWRFQPAESVTAVSGLPLVLFNVFVTKDGNTSFVSVGLNFGLLNGKGYTYLLKKEKDHWKVVGILSTWIS
jgi:hypothetical protein